MADDQNKQEEQKIEETPKKEVPAEQITDQAPSEVGDGEEESRRVAAANEVSEDAGAPRRGTDTEPAGPTSEETPKKVPKPVSTNLEKIIEQIEKLSVLELADLVHALEDKFGVSAQAPVAVAATGAPNGTTEPVEEKTTFNVILTAAGANKIAVIKAVRELVPTLGLKEAKDLVEAAPKPVLESVNKTTAEEAKTKLTAAGGTVELQ